MSFANPWMLAALAAIGLPLLIHYLTRSRPRRVAFPPFRFLMEACAGQQAVHRLRTILLLTMRCLAVFALVLLFARPFLKPRGAASQMEAAKRTVIIIDASLSMRAVQQGVTLFSQAQGEAADVLRSLETGAEAAVILAGTQPQPLLPAMSRNIPAVHEALVQAQPTFEMGNPAAAIAMAKQLFNGSPGTLYIFSDFQQSNWNAVEELPGGLIVRLRPATKGMVENVALTNVRLSPAAPVAGENVEVTCTVFNCTPQPRNETVRLELGEMAQETRVAVGSFSVADASFQITFPRPGVLIGKATLQPDDFREDNARHIALTVHKALQILLVGDDDVTDHRSAAYFVTHAIAPSRETAPGISILRRHSQDVDRGALETADIFVLVAPAQLTGETVEIISRRVTEGGQMIVFLDGPTASALVPATFSPPFQLLNTVTSPTGDSLLSGPRALFAEIAPGDWEGLRFRRHYQNRVLDGRSNDVILSYPDGAVALAFSSVGKGAAVFANLPLTPEGGDLIGSPLFPAMLHELLRKMRGGSEEQAVSPGQAWTLTTASTTSEGLAVEDPEGRTLAARLVASGKVARLALPVARGTGPYVVKQSGSIIGAGVVNIDARESDTRPMPLEKLKAGTGTILSVVRDEQDLALAGTAKPLWPLFAGLTALFLALEMLILAFWKMPVQPATTNASKGFARTQGAAP